MSLETPHTDDGLTADETDFGFNYDADTVIRCASMLEAFHVLPDVGGVLDQDANLLDDILMYNAIKSALRDKSRGHKNDVSDDDTVYMPIKDFLG